MLAKRRRKKNRAGTFTVPLHATQLIIHAQGGGGGGAGGAGGYIGPVSPQSLGRLLGGAAGPSGPMGLTSMPGPVHFGVNMESPSGMKKDLLREVLELNEREKTKGNMAKADGVPDGFIACDGQPLRESHLVRWFKQIAGRKK